MVEEFLKQWWPQIAAFFAIGAWSGANSQRIGQLEKSSGKEPVAEQNAKEIRALYALRREDRERDDKRRDEDHTEATEHRRYLHSQLERIGNELSQIRSNLKG